MNDSATNNSSVSVVATNPGDFML